MKRKSCFTLLLALVLALTPLASMAATDFSSLQAYGDAWIKGQVGDFTKGFQSLDMEFDIVLPPLTRLTSMSINTFYATQNFNFVTAGTDPYGNTENGTQTGILLTKEEITEVSETKEDDDGPKKSLELIRALGVDLPEDATHLTLELLFRALEQILGEELLRPEGVDMNMPVGGADIDVGRVAASSTIAALMPVLTELDWSYGELNSGSLCALIWQACGALENAIPFEIVEKDGVDFAVQLELPEDMADLALNGEAFTGADFTGEFGKLYQVLGHDAGGKMWIAYICVNEDWFEESEEESADEGDETEEEEKLRPCGHKESASGDHSKGACGKSGHYKCDGRSHSKVTAKGTCKKHYKCDGKEHSAAKCGTKGHYKCDGKKHGSAVCEVKGHFKCDKLKHGRGDCGIAGHNKCDGVSHGILACGDYACKPGDHGAASCGVSGHYKCDGKGHGGLACGHHECGGTSGHDKLACGHFGCQSGDHKAAGCGVSGHYACDGKEHSTAICAPAPTIQYEACGRHVLGTAGDHTQQPCKKHYVCSSTGSHFQSCYIPGHFDCDDKDHRRSYCDHHQTEYFMCVDQKTHANCPKPTP